MHLGVRSLIWEHLLRVVGWQQPPSRRDSLTPFSTVLTGKIACDGCFPVPFGFKACNMLMLRHLVFVRTSRLVHRLQGMLIFPTNPPDGTMRQVRCAVIVGLQSSATMQAGQEEKIARSNGSAQGSISAFEFMCEHNPWVFLEHVIVRYRCYRFMLFPDVFECFLCL